MNTAGFLLDKTRCVDNVETAVNRVSTKDTNVIICCVSFQNTNESESEIKRLNMSVFTPEHLTVKLTQTHLKKCGKPQRL